MPSNLELKIKVKSYDSIKKTLKKINAEYVGVLNQKDIYYKCKTGLLKLRIENSSQTLIKYNRAENSKDDRYSEYYLIKISEGESEKVFSEIFEIETVVEKKRLLYLYKNTRIHLDAIKKLGYYLELETLVLNGKRDAKKRFDEMVKILGLDLTKQIRKSNRDLMLGKKNDTNQK
jgi:adenylate cyclase, class 2